MVPCGCTPSLGDLTQTLARPTTPQDILIQIQPKSVMFLQNLEITDHIMLTFLTFQHGDLQLLDLSPACLQFTSIVAVPCEIIRISASTVFTLPMNFSWLIAYLTRCPFLSS